MQTDGGEFQALLSSQFPPSAQSLGQEGVGGTWKLTSTQQAKPASLYSAKIPLEFHKSLIAVIQDPQAKGGEPSISLNSHTLLTRVLE